MRPAPETVQLSVSASRVDFGSVPLNTVSTRTLTLTAMGTASVTVNSATLDGTGFAVSEATFPVTLNPGKSLTLQLNFNPTVAGSASGTMTIASNSSLGHTATVGLSGMGTNSINPVLALSAATLNFGEVAVGVPVSLPVTLTSTGTSPVTVSGATLSGAGFTFSGATFPVRLDPAIAISIQIQFDPGAAGAASGTLTFTSDSTTGATSIVNLVGNGTAVQHHVSLSWNAPANSPAPVSGYNTPVSGYNIYRATGSTGIYQLLNSSAASRMTYTDVTVVSSMTYGYYVTSFDAAGAESVPSNHVTITIP
ncbi:MAG TPA: choice-of-anchor D domain-containing protein [Terracidiphilus sp.]|nr:choice-of-anchor D domain-containing protein [Terracidiphilus sp.]